MINGTCLCGAVTFAVTEPFEYSGYCHCSMCRATTGSAFSAFAAVREHRLKIDGGADLVETFRRGEDVLNHFCKRCGSVLYSLVRDAEYAHVQLGTVAGDPGIRPQMHVFFGSKAPWFEIGDELPRFERLPDA